MILYLRITSNCLKLNAHVLSRVLLKYVMVDNTGCWTRTNAFWKSTFYMHLKVSWFQKDFLKFSFAPKNEQKYFCISGLASKNPKKCLKQKIKAQKTK